ncbi:MAG: hypothetical protein WBH68_00625 [Erysipelotrichaceae bacterium]|nr:hypothetical protein [Bacillota bacterium]NLP21911.1 hypothetical protein [Erysipelotrichaceae bacterium]
MSEKNKDIYGNKKTPIKLSVEEFYEYSKNVKSIYFFIGLFIISFFMLGISVLFIVALEYLNILNVPNTMINILSFLCLILFILLWILIFKKIVSKSKSIYLDKIITVDSNIFESLKNKQKWFKLRFKIMSVITLISTVFGVVLIILTEDRYPHNLNSSTGYILLSVISMFLMVIIPLLLTIYLYSDIFIYNYIDKYYNL